MSYLNCHLLVQICSFNTLFSVFVNISHQISPKQRTGKNTVNSVQTPCRSFILVGTGFPVHGLWQSRICWLDLVRIILELHHQTIIYQRFPHMNPIYIVDAWNTLYMSSTNVIPIVLSRCHPKIPKTPGRITAAQWRWRWQRLRSPALGCALGRTGVGRRLAMPWGCTKNSLEGLSHGKSD